MANSVMKRALSILNVPQYTSRLNTCYRNMASAKTYFSLVIELNDAYRIMKKAAATICNDKTNNFYEKLRAITIDCEDFCNNLFIVDNKASFDLYDSRFFGRSVTEINKKDLLDYIVWFTRVKLLETHQKEDSEIVEDFNELSLANDCNLGSNIVKLVCDMLNIPCEVIKIPPAFTDEFQLYNGDGFHYFCLVTIDNIEYIVDTTYKQFFTLDSNILNRLGVMGLDGCKPGVYMMMNNSRKKTAFELLKKGYVVAGRENLKNYFDGFALSYRNGLYYEWIGKVDYMTPYSVSTYFDFISGDKLLFDYEPVEFLGEQQEPLKNEKFRFKI